MPGLADATYAQTLVFESIHDYTHTDTHTGRHTDATENGTSSANMGHKYGYIRVLCVDLHGYSFHESSSCTLKWTKTQCCPGWPVFCIHGVVGGRDKWPIKRLDGGLTVRISEKGWEVKL